MKLENIRVVLVDTSHPGNIGGCARAMKNMSLERLYLVNPQRFPDQEAVARAAGADDILGRAVVCSSLMEALEGCGLVIAASARLRRLSWPQLTPRQCAETVDSDSETTQVALVFGREHSGLNNQELDMAHYLLHIPCNPDFSSLNLAAAVQVVCYELAAQRLQGMTGDQARREQPASAEELERLYQHMEQALSEVDFLEAKNPRKTMRRLRRLYNRARLETMEVAILRGIFNAMQKAARGNS